MKNAIQFDYRETRLGDDMLVIKTNQHVEIEFLYDKGDEATHVYIDGDEFPLTSDTLYGLFVAIGDQFISIIDPSRKADEEFPEIKEEIEQEARDEEDMRRELSSPYLTGRI